jgi:hypothetical protein
MYINSDQVAISFKRLSSRKESGKTHLERTSVLMYFLAFDAVCKSSGYNRLDLNPEKTDGKSNRKAIELEFTKLVLLERSRKSIVQVSELGKVDCNAKDPEKRISSNFLTVPLKKASEQTDPYFYPKRPAAPLMGLGHPATGLKWGLGYSKDWEVNLPKLFSDIKDSTPFTDLAIFVFRDTWFPDNTSDYIQALSLCIIERFTSELAKFWVDRIEKEKVLVRHISSPFSIVHQPFAKPSKTTSSRDLGSIKKEYLIDHIVYLENVLTVNNIDFDLKIKEI